MTFYTKFIRLIQMKYPFSHSFVFILALCLAISIGINSVLLTQSINRSIVVAVPDGDSIDLADGRRIRLISIDAPERSRCFADEARKKLSDLTLNKSVRLKQITKDSYGRQLALVYVGNNFIQYDLVSGGYAKLTGSSLQNGILEQASNSAKEQQLGIYSPTCRPKTAPNNCQIKGNTRAGTHIYHLPECDNYTQTNIDLSFGDQWFCTEQDAREAGFVKATGCR